MPQAPRVLLLTLLDASWKDDDRAWFEKNSSRAHRLRRLFPGEIDLSLLPGEAPPGHEWQIVVRQVTPGERVKMPLCRNTACPIPDVEPVLHAVFDLAAKDREPGAVISVKEAAELALKYAAAEDGAPS